VDEPVSLVKRIAGSCKLDMLQFHGDEPVEYCRRFKGYKVIKAFRVTSGVDARKISEFKGLPVSF